MSYFLLDAAVKTTESTAWVAPVITSITTALAGYALLKIEERSKALKEVKEEGKKVDSLEKNLKYNSDVQDRIHEELNKIQGYTGCSRVSLYHYHNGTKTHQGYCMNFVSMTDEVTDNIVAPIIENFQALPAASFRSILNKIDSSIEGYTVSLRDQGTPEENAIYNKYQVNVCYNFKVGNSVWEGVVSLSWVNTSRILTDSEVSHVMRFIETVATLQKQLIKTTK